jgi:hypothetical protein
MFWDYCVEIMSYGGGSYRYSPLTKYAGSSNHGHYGSSHSLNSYTPSSLYSSQPSSYGVGSSYGGASAYSSGPTSGYGSGYSSRSGSTSSISSLGSTGYGASSVPYRVGRLLNVIQNSEGCQRKKLFSVMIYTCGWYLKYINQICFAFWLFY